MAKKMLKDEVIAALRKMQGERSLRQFAEELEVSAPFLSDVYHGHRSPGKKLLKRLGLRKVTTVTTVYEKSA